ncbi:MAG TPA: hypothetical protein VHR45_11840 [Thermoanaerobaculia bacterium]|jgi:hypothetical protein|nr:hypothetical protein [Thermoanaerobaculia bacterium]
MLLPTILFVLFALLAAAGAYLILSHHRGRVAGIAGALATLLAFAALFWGLLALLREGGAL